MPSRRERRARESPCAPRNALAIPGERRGKAGPHAIYGRAHLPGFDPVVFRHAARNRVHGAIRHGARGAGRAESRKDPSALLDLVRVVVEHVDEGVLRRAQGRDCGAPSARAFG